MKTALIADMHLKPGVQPEQNATLRRTLQDILDCGTTRAVLLGDAFNGWFERRGRIVGDYQEVFSIFQDAANKGLDINHVSGNRDFAVGRAIPDKLGQCYPGYYTKCKDGGGISQLALNGITPRGQAFNIRQDGMLIHCVHGDNYCLRDWAHQLLRFWVMSTAPRIGAAVWPFWFFDKIIGFAQKRDVFPHFGIIPYTSNICDEELTPLVDNGVDIVFCGHFHRNEEREVMGNKRCGKLIIVNCWSRTGDWGLLDGKNFAMNSSGS